MHFVTIHPSDNVKVNLSDGHKYAKLDIKKGDSVIKYGFPIGVASKDIKAGEKVHTDNLKTSLGGVSDYSYCPDFCVPQKENAPKIMAYVRKNGTVGIRNDIWIINTVGCINKTAEILSRKTGALTFPHPYGCSQLGDDFKVTQKILCGLICHPNAGGVLVLGLGCENNNITELKKVLKGFDPDRVRFLSIQECDDEITEGEKLINELKEIAAADKRESVSCERLKIGLKCGGSDGLSGITANPLVGTITDKFTGVGGTAVLTEVPEMFGAEQLLMNRCASKDVFQKTVQLINNYKSYFISHNQPVSENPSPGNKAGGITTLEEKSLGCVQKGGKAVITDVLDYGDTAKTAGLNLLNGPGNDIVAVTNLTAAGCNPILFTTGRGTPLGAPVPTIKIATNSVLAEKKKHWIDFSASEFLDDKSESDRLFNFILDVANGKQTKNEENGYREIAIFKDGVTL